MVNRLLIIIVVLALRLPFLHQAIQGDDVFYLYGAEHAQIEPLHPDHARYLFQGDMVDMRGHPHPPLNSWMLAALLAIFGEVREVPFHLAYSLFSIIAALAMYSIARRFCDRPLLATLLFVAVPAFVVNGNSFESDIPFLAFWMLTIALFFRGVEENWRIALIGAAFASVLAAMTAYQSIFVVPILALYLLRRKNRDVVAWSVILVVPLTIAAWQVYSRTTSGVMPVTVLAGYLDKYHLEVSLLRKLKSSVALVVHLAWIVSPILIRGRSRNWIFGGIAAAAGVFYDPNPLFWISLGLGVVMLVSSIRGFLGKWILIFFTCGVVVFFAGSARYLLPIAAPVAILAVRNCSTRFIAAGFTLQMALSVALAAVNYQHWSAYRQFARSLEREVATRRVWIDADWGLRYYLETEGGLVYPKGQEFLPGEMIVRSERSDPNPPRAQLAPFSQMEIRPAIPLRIFSIEKKSAYSVAEEGLRPFDISKGPIDRVTAGLVIERKPILTWVTPNDQDQVIGGIFPDNWTSGEARVLVKRGSGELRAEFTIPPMAPARHVSMFVDGKLAAEQTFSGPGSYSLSASAPGDLEGVTVMLAVDKTFPAPPPDERMLGMLVTGIGFK